MNKVDFNYQVLYFLIFFHMVCLIELIDPLSGPVKSRISCPYTTMTSKITYMTYMSVIQSVYIFPHAHTGENGKILSSTCY